MGMKQHIALVRLRQPTLIYRLLLHDNNVKYSYYKPSHSVSHIWNSLPAALRTTTLSPLAFARHLKTHLFDWD